MPPGPLRRSLNPVARDEEFRKVAEDLRALGRSLARDFWQAADQARRSGRPPSHIIRHGLRQMAGEARRGLFGEDVRRDPRWVRPHRGAWGGYPRWGPPPGRGASRPGGWRGFGPPVGAAPAPRPRRPARPPVRRRWDATTLLGTLIVLFGSAWLLGALHAIRVPLEGVVAVGLMLLGGAVVLTARTDWSLSRRAWPLWVGAALVVVLVATSGTLGIAGTLDHVQFGTMQRTATAGQTVYGGFGNLSVDARGLKPGGVLKVESAAGETHIDTPPGIPVEIHARVLAGRVCVEGAPQAQGLEAGVNALFGSGPAEPITVTVRQMAGAVIIDGSGCSRR